MQAEALSGQLPFSRALPRAEEGEALVGILAPSLTLPSQGLSPLRRDIIIPGTALPRPTPHYDRAQGRPVLSQPIRLAEHPWPTPALFVASLAK